MILSVTPGQQIVKIVYDEMVNLMQKEKGELSLSKNFSTIMLVGLQGSGKTTTAGKIAKFLKEQGLLTMLVAADTKRLAARDQLKTIANKTGIDFFTVENEDNPLIIVNAAKEAARKKGLNRLIVDTAGRLHIDSVLMDELRILKNALSPEAILPQDRMLSTYAKSLIQCSI